MDIELKRVNIGSIVKFKDEDRAILVNNFDYNEFTKNLTLIGYYEAKNDHLYDKSKLYHVDNIILPNGEKRSIIKILIYRLMYLRVQMLIM